ncbi:hypothetical protein ANO14919_097480 [Xylariales sp. No.14919]|nr:hypothetical protein ANO14919_097480 [Xylariales sp. No.14919]
MIGQQALISLIQYVIVNMLKRVLSTSSIGWRGWWVKYAGVVPSPSNAAHLHMDSDTGLAIAANIPRALTQAFPRSIVSVNSPPG